MSVTPSPEPDSPADPEIDVETEVDIDTGRPEAASDGAEQPVSPDTAPDDLGDQGDEDISPDSLRTDPSIGEELYGARYERAVYHHNRVAGPAAFGNNNVVVSTTVTAWLSNERVVKPIIRPLPDVRILMGGYATTAADAALDRLVAQRSTACLSGPSGTGRFSTTCAALARRYGPDAVYEILLPAGAEPTDLYRDENTIEDGCGYLLRLPGGGHVSVMRQLGDLFRRHSASLILIKDEDPRGGTRHSAEIPHRVPDPLAVFRRQLGQLLRNSADLAKSDVDAWVDVYLARDDLVGALRQAYGPREVVAVAREVASRHPIDDSAMGEILAASQPRRRQRAAEIMLPELAADVPRRNRREGQHARSFRIAYAVFCWQPLHHVFDAADLLLRRIDGEAKRPEWGRMALQYPVRELLGPLAVDWEEGRERGARLPGTSRSAWLRDKAMRGAIIDVAWHEFDATRPALIDWLDELVENNDEPVRRAAAQAAGLLADHDFERVCRDLVDRWASAPRGRTRQAAAWALVAADMGGRVGHLVRTKVRHWAHGGSNRQRDSAARVYASGLEQPHLSWSLADLRRIAEDRMQRDKQAVAEGIYQLYTSRHVEWIISELGEWAHHRQLHPHAARSMVALAEKPAGDAPGAPPELLDRLACGDIGGAALATMWTAALLDGGTSRRGWQTLGRWLWHAERDENLRKPAGELLRELGRSPAVQRRLKFHLPRMAEFRDGVPEWIDVDGEGA